MLAPRPDWIDGNAISVGASVGVSIWSPEETGVELALQRADAMLYEAKEAGRGRYVTALGPRMPQAPVRPFIRA